MRIWFLLRLFFYSFRFLFLFSFALFTAPTLALDMLMQLQLYLYLCLYLYIYLYLYLWLCLPFVSVFAAIDEHKLIIKAVNLHQLPLALAVSVSPSISVAVCACISQIHATSSSQFRINFLRKQNRKIQNKTSSQSICLPLLLPQLLLLPLSCLFLQLLLLLLLLLLGPHYLVNVERFRAFGFFFLILFLLCFFFAIFVQCTCVQRVQKFAFLMTLLLIAACLFLLDTPLPPSPLLLVGPPPLPTLLLAFNIRSFIIMKCEISAQKDSPKISRFIIYCRVQRSFFVLFVFDCLLWKNYNALSACD